MNPKTLTIYQKLEGCNNVGSSNRKILFQYRRQYSLLLFQCNPHLPNLLIFLLNFCKTEARNNATLMLRKGIPIAND